MKWILKGIWLLAATTATAANADCADHPWASRGMLDCYRASYRQLDASLNHVYQRARRSVRGDVGVTNALVSSQRQWINDRETICHNESLQGDTEREMKIHWLQCAIRETHGRIDYLQETYQVVTEF